MMETWLVKSIAERKLGRLSSYNSLTEDLESVRSILNRATFRDDELAVGVYEINKDQLQPPIVITNLGMHVFFQPANVIIDYADIQSTDGPETKEEISGIKINLVDGRSIAVPIRGAHDQFRDAFPFLQFLLGITLAKTSVSSKEGRDKENH